MPRVLSVLTELILFIEKMVLALTETSKSYIDPKDHIVEVEIVKATLISGV
jgi:hypothetical protein